MQKVKITINGEDRCVILPMEYSPETDVIELKEVNIEPMPKEDEDVSQDLVLYLTQLILVGLQETNKKENKD